jgi:hypothetical protein
LTVNQQGVRKGALFFLSPYFQAVDACGQPIPAKMSNQTVLLINTRLQPGVGSPPTREPFQRLAGAGKTVETVLTGLAEHHRAEARC